MVRNATLVLFLFAMAGVSIAAQERDIAKMEEGQEREQTANSETSGDVITFTSGKQLRGMQVLRETARTVSVQVLAGTDPLVLSKRFIARIDYDQATPAPENTSATTSKSTEPNVIVADRLSGELHKNLNRPLPGAFLKSDGEDFVRLLERLSRATKVRIDIGDEVRALAPGARQWRYNVNNKTSLESLLRESLLVRFDRLTILYRFDHIVVTMTQPEDPAKPKR